MYIWKNIASDFPVGMDIGEKEVSDSSVSYRDLIEIFVY